MADVKQSFKDIVEKTVMDSPNPQTDVPKTYEEFIEAYNEYVKPPSITNTYTNKQTQLANDFVDEVLMDIGEGFNILKDKYQDNGFLNDATFGEFLNLLKKNIYIEEVQKDNDDADEINGFEDEIII